jgi:hypothetical protein
MVLLQTLADFGHEFIFIGEAAGLELGVQQLAVGVQLEATAAGWLQLQAREFVFVPTEDFGRQTDGLRFVVSGSAIT